MPTTQPFDLQKSALYRRSSRLPLWVVLIIPFIIIIIVVVSAINYLSYRNSQAVVGDIAGQLMSEINTRIDSHITSFFETPQIVNRGNANFIRQHMIDITDIDEVGQHFWKKVQLYKSISSMYFGNPDGGLVSGGREGADGSLYIMLSDDFKSGAVNKYATDEDGNYTDLLAHIDHFDSRLRPWYIGAVENPGIYWTAPYVLSTQQDLAIASSLAVYDDTDELIGVVSVDLFISQINDFLQGLDIGKNGQTYIVEHSGLLVATSSSTPTVRKDDAGTWQRISALDSENPIIAESSKYISDEMGSLVDFEAALKKSIQIDGKDNYLWVSTFHNIHGLDWLIVTIIPKEDFLAAISAQNHVTFALTFIALIIAIIVSIVTAFFISQPITRLGDAATQLARGDWSQRVPVEGVEEIRKLGQAFNMMSAQLRELFNNLEIRVQDRTAALAQSEARYRGIVEDQTELICRFAPDNTLTFVNDAYCRYFNKSHEELVGKSFMPKLPEEDQLYLEQELANLSPSQPSIRVEHRVILPGNQVRWMEWINRAFYDESGQLVEIQAVGRDVTASKQHEAALEKALAKEMELNELKSHFISTVSHEFRTPMAIILNSSEILNRYGGRIAQEKKEIHFNRIQEQIHRMTYLLEDILTIHQTETGKLELHLVELDFVALCQDVMSDIQVTTKDISFDFSFTGDCNAVWLDAKLVRLIVSNLISNAVKYSVSGGKVNVHLDCDSEQLLLSVQDEGIGIPKAVQAHIFEPFFRANNVETIMGTGLGLAIVKRCVEYHQGTISVESNLGDGTTFTVCLPNIHSEE